MMDTKDHRPVLLCILDGWGSSARTEGNAIFLAHTPHWDRIWAENPHCLLQASEGHVGLPIGQMGNSEVGHMNIGAGRVTVQDLPRIDQVVAAGELVNIKALKKLIKKLSASGGVCHLMGLISTGGVHSHQSHILALAQVLSSESVGVRIHAFLDGRDTPPNSGLFYLQKLKTEIEGLHNVKIATISGRYYGMDRDQRWDRIETAYRAIVSGDCRRVASVLEGVKESYSAQVGDEFVRPMAVDDYTGMKDGDGLLMANFRADRVRQIMLAFVDPTFDNFPRLPHIKFAARIGLTNYSEQISRFVDTMFPPRMLRDTLGEVVSKTGLRQLRIAETEKYAHVTFFLNGGREVLYPGEERILVPSPKVATYDLKPEMSAVKLTKRLLGAIDSGRFGLIVANFANADMVGHTGKIAAACRAVETVDSCLGSIAEAVHERNGVMVVTADHGNVEQMLDSDLSELHTAHTVNPVPLVVLGVEKMEVLNGTLSDVAPTILDLMGLPIPGAMTGKTLFASSIYR